MPHEEPPLLEQALAAGLDDARARVDDELAALARYHSLASRYTPSK
ncbi:hypothetical protein [Streptomyces sp. NPDC059979]